mgnify:CR=1 FL=1
MDVSSGSLLSNYDGDVTITGTVTLAGISTITFVSSKFIFYNLFIFIELRSLSSLPGTPIGFISSKMQARFWAEANIANHDDVIHTSQWKPDNRIWRYPLAPSDEFKVSDG